MMGKDVVKFYKINIRLKQVLLNSSASVLLNVSLLGTSLCISLWASANVSTDTKSSQENVKFLNTYIHILTLNIYILTTKGL